MSHASSLSDRVAARRRRRRGRALWALLVIAVVLAAAAVAWFSPALALQSVSVAGGGLTDAGAVRERVLERYRGTPLPQIRLAPLGRELTAENPKASRIDVRWSGPRSLRVSIVDRAPVLAVEVEGGWQRYDADGRAIDTAAKRPEGLPQLITRGAPSAATVRAAVDMLGQLPEDARAATKRAQAASERDLRIVYDADGRDVEIRFGDAADIAKKFEVARVLLGRRPGFIDVSVPDAPTTGRR
ncbi:cell division protein FtsQ/DivIB [Brevibacterium sp. BRM-1]|uniref:cell division protein FtsQ/DivIB n=1 Tax=Brevibacterium sp. BRM-1 TaxID=2999062 RepID=UPI002280487C|nr:cell division protein FtsQ/DivIB [Brevibacterium sp. BRM-1]WAL41082.1 cell division protein FtsQ/DivIB [Brevibacterium sp. BRM-1]